MTARLEIDATALLRVSRALGPKMTRRMIVSGVNEAGKTLRKGVPVALEQQGRARKIRSRSKAQAAFAGSASPRYRLALPAGVPIRDLKTAKATKRKGKRQVSFKSWTGEKLVFSATRQDGKGARRRTILLPAVDRPERAAGALPVPSLNLFDRRRFPGPAAALDDANEAAIARMRATVDKAMTAAMARARL